MKENLRNSNDYEASYHPFWIFIGLSIIDIILMFTCCDGGYPWDDDKWKSPFLEKLHYIIAPIGLFGSIITCFIFLFFGGCGC